MNENILSCSCGVLLDKDEFMHKENRNLYPGDLYVGLRGKCPVCGKIYEDFSYDNIY